MTAVVDASVAVKWYVAEDGSAEALALIEHADRLIAPDLVIAEACNALWSLLRRGHVDVSQYREALSGLAGEFDELAPCSGLAGAAGEIARALDHPVYDCFYLALAERAGAAVVTADRRFLDKVRGSLWEKRTRDLYRQKDRP